MICGDSGKKQVSRAAGVVGLFTLLSRFAGLVRDIVVAVMFGSSSAADAFFVAFRIPNLLRSLFAEGALTVAFIPLFTEYLTIKGKDQALELARVVLTILSLILAVITVAGILFAPWIVSIQAFGFGLEGHRHDLTVLLTKITFPYIFLISIVAFFMGILNSLKHFAAPAASPILLNIGIILSAWLLAPVLEEPVVSLAIGVLIGGVLQVLLQVPWVLRSGLKLIPLWQPRHPALKRMGILVLPAIFGAAVYQFNQFVGTLLASFLEEGSVSWLYYADRLVQFPLGVFAIALSTASLPSLAACAANKDMARFDEIISSALRLVFFISIPSLIGLIVMGELLIAVIFEHGAFDAKSSLMTYWALIFYSIGLWAFSGIKILISGFYAAQDTKTPLKGAGLAFIINAVLGIFFMEKIGHMGLALALSSAATVQFFFLAVRLKKRIVDINFKEILKTVIKTIAASIVMGCILLVLGNFLKEWVVSSIIFQIFKLIILLFTGISVFLSTAKLLHCNELDSVLDMFRPLLGFFKAKG